MSGKFKLGEKSKSPEDETNVLSDSDEQKANLNGSGKEKNLNNFNRPKLAGPGDN